MTKQDYLNNVANIPENEIVKGISKGIVSFDELQKTGRFKREKQAEVRMALQKLEVEKEAYNTAKKTNTISGYNGFLLKFPNSEYKYEVERLKKRREEEIEEEKMKRFTEVKDYPNKYTIKEAKDRLGDDLFRKLCDVWELNYNDIINYEPTKLNFNMIPNSIDEVPNDYTDIFFWGVPSSGKTTALASIFRTINDKYVMEDDSTLDKQFGSSYRSDLINVYKEGLGFLPARTQKDKTQYMPFLLRRRSEKRKKNRKISFFELSGEVFEHFLEIREGLKDKEDLKDEELERRIEIEKSFRTIELLLGSNNRIIHFFFIDYDKELSNLKKRDSKSQANYLSAAGTYFQSNNNIFSSKTNAIYFIITKADTIDGENKVEIAADFLREHFGNFYTVIEGRCEEHSIKKPEIKLFSIGDVYFNRISKIDYKYSKNIVETILNEVHPEENNWFKKILSK